MNIEILPDEENNDRFHFPRSADNAETEATEYFDLKNDPASYSQMEWLIGFPAVERFLRDINTANSFFRTVRWERASPWSMGRRGHAYQVEWNVTLAFEVLELNTFANFEAFRRELRRSEPASEQLTHLFQLRHVPARFHEDVQEEAAVQEVTLIGFGNTPIEAESKFNHLIADFSKFLRSQNGFLEDFSGSRMIS